jgi:U3 small nucleolar RNA-associated protein MPP10
MEAFADAEEEYHMPVDEDDAKEEKTKKNDKKQKPKKSYERFSSDEEDDNDEEEKLVMNFRRKKFRSDEEIDALLSLYNENANEEDDSEGDAIINMTAADVFGRPNSKYLENRKRTEDRQRYTFTQRVNRDNAEFDDDDGSWGEQKDDNEDHEWNNNRNGFDSEDAANDYDSSADAEKPLGDSKKIIKKGEKDQQTLKKLKLEEQTKQLESEVLAEKPWAMRGETSATARPLNSLLEATPQFEVSSKVAPIVTQEHSESIEAVIKQRILAEDWDVSSACAHIY